MENCWVLKKQAENVQNAVKLKKKLEYLKGAEKLLLNLKCP